MSVFYDLALFLLNSISSFKSFESKLQEERIRNVVYNMNVCKWYVLAYF